MKRFRRTTPFLLLALLVLVPAVEAQVPTPSDDDVNRVARELYCPVCENVPLDVCPTQACADWRADIRDKLAQGWSDEQIKAYFAQQHGDRVLAQPPARGLAILVYLIPPLALLVGAALVVRFLRSSRPVTPPPASTLPATPDAYQARLEKELRERF
ncbi:MAG: cytochrome c-type biogenesis protein [Anaerolineales bacterium]